MSNSGPAFVLVPPTPVYAASEQGFKAQGENAERGSTETTRTLMSIYSVYGYGASDNRSSWSPDTASTSKRNTIAERPQSQYHERPASKRVSSFEPQQSRLSQYGQQQGRSRMSIVEPAPRTASPVLADASPSGTRRNPSPQRAMTPQTPLASSSPRLRPPRTPPKFSGHLSSTPSSPASVLSLTPSDGEGDDAFHVRSTYAQLEMYGVKGDGYEEGIERTRARVGPSRASQFNADSAIGDGTEKTRELDPKEIQTLASLDRYGFFVIPSHDRLVVLPTAPLAKRLSQSSAGPGAAPSQAQSLPKLPPVILPPKESTRIAKWTRMLEPRSRDQGANVEAWGIKPNKEAKLRERAYKGIPDRWRGAAWGLLMCRFSRNGSPADSAKLAQDYRDTLDKASSFDVQIDLDVPRTISGHVMFRTRYGAGQRSLFHVLHCFSLRCEECGYVQGMGPIAATLLCYFNPEQVYAALVRLHDAYNLHTIFAPGFPGLLEAIYVQERITEQMMPDVYAAFKTHTVSTMSYATKWYITLFANSVPFQTQLRLWDIFLLEGPDVYIAVSVAIVWAYRDQITSASANFETVLSMLSSYFVPESEDGLMSWLEKTLGDKKLRANMEQWRYDWKALVKTGKDGEALL